MRLIRNGGGKEQRIFITFIYTHLERVYYLVRYVDQNGIKLADDKGPFETSDATVTVAYMNINGYTIKSGAS